MKRKAASPRKTAAPFSSCFADTEVLILEDGGISPHDISPMRAGLLLKKIEQHGGTAEVIPANEVLEGHLRAPEQRDSKLCRATHVVLSKSLEGKVPALVESLRREKNKDVNENGTIYAPLPLTVGRSCQVVSPDWVSDCLLHRQLVDPRPYLLSLAREERNEGGDASTEAATKRVEAAEPTAGGTKKARLSHPSASTPTVVSPTHAAIEACLAPFSDLDPTTRDAFFAYGGPLVLSKPYSASFPKFACQRPAPAQHPNRHLTPLFEDLVEMYGLGVGDKERETAFGRVLAVLRACPWKVRESKELKGIRHVGGSMRAVIEEILTTGRCSRLEKLREDSSHRCLLDLCRIHQVGHATARKWYEAGYRSVAQIQADLKRAEETGDGEEQAGGGVERYLGSTFCTSQRPSMEQLLGILFVDEYSVKMTRCQVAALEGIVREAALKALAARGLGAETLLLQTCGGYLRGKVLNGDADVLVSCTQAQGQAGLREEIKRIMQEDMGIDLLILKEGNTMGGFASKPAHEKIASHDNMLTLIKHEGLYRRLDVISPPPDQWAFCVLGWSGSKQMEKDLRDYADEQGLHLSQQAVFRETKRLTNPKSIDGVFHSEEDVWEFLGLKYLPPRLRCA